EVPAEIETGLVVMAVDPRSRAAAIGLRPGGVIVEAGREPVDSVAVLAERYRAAEERLLLVVWRGGVTHYVVLEKQAAASPCALDTPSRRSPGGQNPQNREET